jgi:hypothetical protein
MRLPTASSQNAKNELGDGSKHVLWLAPKWLLLLEDSCGDVVFVGFNLVDFLFGDDVSSAVQSCGFVVFAV